jgi:hypothetical protein
LELVFYYAVVCKYAPSGTGTLLHRDRLSFGRKSPSR